MLKQEKKQITTGIIMSSSKASCMAHALIFHLSFFTALPVQITTGIIMSSSEASCNLPTPRPTSSPVRIRVSTNGVDFSRSSLLFDFGEPLTLLSVEPKSMFSGAGSGVQITVRGSGFQHRDGLQCRIGDRCGAESPTFTAGIDLLLESPCSAYFANCTSIKALALSACNALHPGHGVYLALYVMSLYLKLVHLTIEE